MTVVDLWVDDCHLQVAQAFLGQTGNESVTGMLGSDLDAARTLDDVVATMDATRVDLGIIAAGLTALGTESLLHQAGSRPTRRRVDRGPLGLPASPAPRGPAHRLQGHDGDRRRDGPPL